MEGRCVSCKFSSTIPPLKTVVHCRKMVVLKGAISAHVCDGESIPYSMKDSTVYLVVEPYFGCINYQMRIWSEEEK